MGHTLNHCKTVDLIQRIRNTPQGVSLRDAAVQLVKTGEATPEEAFFAQIAAEIMTKPLCCECNKTITKKQKVEQFGCCDECNAKYNEHVCCA